MAFLAAALPFLAKAAAPALIGKIFGGSFGGSGPSMKKFSTLSHGQKGMLNDLIKHPERLLPQLSQNPMFQQGQNYLSGILSQDPAMMKQFEAPAMRQFQQEIVPGIAERFSGVGARDSSAFNQAMGAAGSDLSERLAAMRANLGMNASQQAFGYAQLPYQQAMQRMQLALGTPAFGQQAFQGTPGFGQGMLGAFGKGIGSSMAQDMPGMMSSFGNMFSGMFGGGSAPQRIMEASSGFLGG